MKAHEHAVGLLAQGVPALEPLGAADRLGQAPGVLQFVREALERRGVELRQALALLEQPFVVAALEQVAGVRVDRLLQAAVRDRVLEDRDIEPERGLLAPLQRARAHVDQAIGIRERSAQVVQDLTEIRPRLGLGRVWPEQEREALTWLRRVAMHQQVRQQRLGARRIQGRHPRLAQAHVEAAEQTDAQRRPRMSGRPDSPLAASICANTTERMAARGGVRPAPTRGQRTSAPFPRTTSQSPPNSRTFWHRIWPGLRSPT